MFKLRTHIPNKVHRANFTIAVKILDFGLAKIVSAGNADATRATHERKQAPRSAPPPIMSLERARRSSDLSAQLDQFGVARCRTCGFCAAVSRSLFCAALPDGSP